jgi:hypothetical protein
MKGTSGNIGQTFATATEVSDQKDYSILNLGPTHPATHGIFQNILKMDGEIIIHAEPTIGYIHRAFENAGLTIKLPPLQIGSTIVLHRSTTWDGI